MLQLLTPQEQPWYKGCPDASLGLFRSCIDCLCFLAPIWPLLAVPKPSSALIIELRTWKSNRQASLEAWGCPKRERRGTAASPCLPGCGFGVPGVTARWLEHLPQKILTSGQKTRASATSGRAKPALALLSSGLLIDLHRSGSVCPGCRQMN